jgi:hypothetical protein
MEVSSQPHAPVFLPPRNDPPVPVWMRIGWAPEPVWTRESNPSRPVRSLNTILTELSDKFCMYFSFLRRATYSTHFILPDLITLTMFGKQYNLLVLHYAFFSILLLQAQTLCNISQLPIGCLRWEAVKFPNWRSTLCRLSTTAYSVHQQLPSIAGGRLITTPS